MPSTTPSHMPRNEGRSRPERRTVMFRTNHGNQSLNLAARMGRWSYDHRRPRRSVGSRSSSSPWRPAAWPARRPSTRTRPGRASPVVWTGSSTRACPADESVSSRAALSATDPAFTAAVEDAVAGLSKVDVVQNVRSPLDEANAGQIARTAAWRFVEFEIRGPADEAADKSTRSSTRSTPRRRLIPSSSSASSGTPAPSRRSIRRSRTTWGRPASCHSRSR